MVDQFRIQNRYQKENGMNTHLVIDLYHLIAFPYDYGINRFADISVETYDIQDVYDQGGSYLCILVKYIFKTIGIITISQWSFTKA